nr:protein FAR1-RELATED SEQUENCE 5-like [Ipomoea batatas]GMD81460.1 protein FAR1-RELATED SEQUENCE 5-like [Ipomoea batatas]
MPSQFVLASQVTPIHTRRAMRLRLVRTYEVPELRGRATSKSKECLFHDEEVNIKKNPKQNYGYAFSVMKILNDENIVAAYCSAFGADQEKDLISKMIEEYGDEETDDDESGADEVNSPNNVVLPRKPTGDQEMSPLSKRSLLDQFSSTQQMKKGRLDNIKKEKTV